MRPIYRCTTLWFTICLMNLFLVAGCNKKESPNPDLVAAVMGTYRMTTVSLAGSSQPVTVTGGTVLVVRSGMSMNTVEMTVSYATASTSGSSSFSETGIISLEPSGNAIALLSGANKVGSWFNGVLTLNNYPFNNASVSFTATR